VKDVEFAILRRRDFSRILGIAQDVRRLSRGIPLLRQAAELVSKSIDQELAIRHFSELTVSLSDVVTSGPVPYDDADLALEPSETSIDLDALSAASVCDPRHRRRNPADQYRIRRVRRSARSADGHCFA
jgi:hypothetical protein